MRLVARITSSTHILHLNLHEESDFRSTAELRQPNVALILIRSLNTLLLEAHPYSSAAYRAVQVGFKIANIKGMRFARNDCYNNP